MDREDGYHEGFLLAHRTDKTDELEDTILFEVAKDYNTRTSAVSSTALSDVGNWHFIAATFTDQQFMKIYIDGVLDNTTLIDFSWESAASSDFLIGERTDELYISGSPINGTLDEIQMYRQALTAEQIYALYENGLTGQQLKTIVSNETTVGDNWTVAVTPNDREDDGNTVISNALIIENSEPTITLLTPTNNETLSGWNNRTPRLT